MESSDIEGDIDCGNAIETVCEPCKRKNILTIATIFCKPCKEILCKECSHPHTIYKPGIHVMENIRDMDSVPLAVEMKGMDVCEEHGREIEYFCHDDSKLICSRCVIKHLTCNIDDLASVTEQDERAFNDLKQSLQTCETDTKRIIAESKQSEIALTESIKDISKQVDAWHERITKLFQEAKAKMMAEADLIKIQEVERLRERQLESSKVMKEIHDMFLLCSVVLKNGTPQQKHIFFRNVKVTLKQAAIHIKEKNATPLTSKITLTVNKELLSLIDNDMAMFNLDRNSTYIDVKTVLKNRPIKMKEKEVSVQIYSPKKLNTIIVHGPKEIMTEENDDIFEKHFESERRSGGGEIAKIDFRSEESAFYITFEEEDVAKAVAERQHTVEGHELEVSLYTPPVPPSSYPDKLLIKGLNPKITFSVLELYMEARAGITLVQGSMTYHVDQKDTALVTVDGEIDITKIEELCKSKPLEGSFLRFSLVPITNCVLVSNISDAVTEDMISLYFENAKRSNGGIVEKVEMFPTQNYCLVFFVDYKVVDNVLSKEQMLDGRQLEVSRYFPCIGRAEGDTVKQLFKTPAPFTVKANVQKLIF